MSLRITWNFQSAENVRDFDTDRLVIGRFAAADPKGLDLSFDVNVSRQHAVIEVKEDAAWLTDLGSRYGTHVNGEQVRSHEHRRLQPNDAIRVGQTLLRIAVIAERSASPALATPQAAAVADTNPVALDVKILKTLDSQRTMLFGQDATASATAKRLATLLDLPRQLAEQADRSEILQIIMNRIVEAIPCARRGALLMCDPQKDALLLKAYVSSDEPVVSEKLARRALHEKRGFIWRSSAGDTSRSLLHFQIVTGMYAPLQWQDQVFGVICVDTPTATDTFQEQDLEFLMAIGQYAAMTLADQQLRAELKQSTKLVGRLLANFSPKVRALLLHQAREGKLRPGGVKSEITVLFCDICGFTRQSAAMDARDVVDMLNQYFQPMVDTILRHDGTVDKFVGDAVLAVFGSPEADPLHHQKAVQAAMDIQKAVRATSEMRSNRGDVAFQVRIGLDCGEVLHGFIGTMDRLEFTVIGDAVNRASRYCECAGEGEVLISPGIFQHIFSLIKADKTTIQAKEGPMSAYRVKEFRAR